MKTTTRSKKNKTTVTTTNPQTSSYDDVLPLDLVIEILGRLPVKSIARFLLVSKLWARTIRSRDFIKSFPLGSCSSHEPRFLIAFCGRDTEKVIYYAREDWYFFSSSFLSRSSCPLPPYPVHNRSHYVKGLLCIGCGRDQFIVNPTTGKSIALPRVRTRRMTSLSFFGYDSVNDEYKVLCMTEAMIGPNHKAPSSQHQVFTLGGAKKRSWRMLECSIPHRPRSRGVCIDCVIYYAAKTGSQRSLMGFDSSSEKFHLITIIPTEIDLSGDEYNHAMILNYQGKVAIPTRTSAYRFDVWVMDQNAEERKWLKKLSFSVEPWKDLFRCIYIKGITQTGEFILAPNCYYSDDVYVALYNHHTDTFRKIKVQVSADHNFRSSLTGIFFSDYIESVRFL